MHVALLGGSYDPPHRGHLELIRYLLDSGDYDQIWIVPSRQNPLKATSSSFEQRLQMCRLAFEALGEKVKVLDDERHLSGYSIDLVKYLQDKYPGLEITFVGGSDLKKQLEQWKDIAELKKLIRFQFLPRLPEENTPFPLISSTELRERVRQGESTEDFIPEKVYRFIEKHRLYRESTP